MHNQTMRTKSIPVVGGGWQGQTKSAQNVIRNLTPAHLRGLISLCAGLAAATLTAQAGNGPRANQSA